MTNKVTNIIIISRILLGLFWLDHGYSKLGSGWLSEDKLSIRLTKSSLTAPAYAKPYINHVLRPAAAVIQRLVLLGEIAVGLAFVVGFWTKPATWGAIFMVINFKFIDGGLLSLGAFSDAYLFPLLAAMVLISYVSTSSKGSIMAFIPNLKRYEYPKS